MATMAIRVVRCPKCKKFLPELPDYSVYICGGCGATLQAKKKNPAYDDSDKQLGEATVKYLEVFRADTGKKNAVGTLRVSNHEEHEVTSGHRGELSTSEELQEISLQAPAQSTHADVSHVERLSRDHSRQRNVGYDLGDQRSSDGSTAVDDFMRNREYLLGVLDEMRDQVMRESSFDVIHRHSMNAPIEWNTSQNKLSTSYSAQSGTQGRHPGQFSSRGLNSSSQLDTNPFPYHRERIIHPTGCSCLTCYNTDLTFPMRRAPGEVDRRSISYLKNNVSHSLKNQPAIELNKLRSLSAPQKNSHVIRETKNFQHAYQPVAGAAPFAICSNCFELLLLPKRSLSYYQSEHNVRCGSCSHLFVVDIDSGWLLNSVKFPSLRVPFNNRYRIQASQRGSEQEIQMMNHKMLAQRGSSVNSFEAQEKLVHVDTNGSEKIEDDRSPVRAFLKKDASQAGKFQQNVVVPKILEDLLAEENDYLSENVSDESLDGSASRYSEHERVAAPADNSKHYVVKDVRVVTETGLPGKNFADPGVSEDLFAKEQDQDKNGTLKVNNGISSAGTKSAKSNNSLQNNKWRISINGHPISENAAKVASKLAGDISPGEYWYDYQAGFWGAMGRPCLGMVPPFIEEFNYPMSKDCAGGDTGVIVNGRELHIKDLELLLNRGLPEKPGRSYRIEISGRVCDEHSGKEICNLGRLAPTVERMKRGFGMRIPKMYQ